MTVMTALFLGACVTTQTVEVSESDLRAAFGDRQIAVIVYPEPELHVVSPGDVTGLGVIDAMTRPDGTRDAFPGPSSVIADRLRATLDSKTDLSFREVANASGPPPKRADVRPEARDTLEIITEVNQIGYRPMNWQTYQYLLRAHARLTGPDGRLVWQHVCRVGGTSEDRTLQINRSDFGPEDGDKLKALIELGAERCADQIAASLVRM